MMRAGILLLLTVFFLQQAYSIQTADAFPLLVEYIEQYRVKVNDLKDVINNQFANITIGKVNTSYAQVKSFNITLSYKNTAVPDFLTPTKVKVSNDSYLASFGFDVTVKHTVGSANYSCEYTTDDIFVNYTKQVDLVSGDTLILAFQSSFAQKLFTKEPRCTKSVNKTDMTRIKEILSNSESSSIYLELNKVLSKMKERIQENVQTQHLSQVFQDNPYNYDFYHFIVSVNVSTVGTEQYGDKGIVNQIKGTIPQTTHLASGVPQHNEGFNLFFSKAFVQNVLDYTIAGYQPWQNIRANRTKMRSRSFRFRLIDFQEIVPSMLKKYPGLYLADTQAICKPLSYDNMVFSVEDQQITLEMKWSCSVSIEVAPESTYTFINFEPTFAYEATVHASNYLSVYEKPVKLVDLIFNIIDEHLIQNTLLAQEAIDECLFEFGTWTIGGFFKVKDGSSKVQIAKDGFWVG